MKRRIFGCGLKIRGFFRRFEFRRREMCNFFCVKDRGFFFGWYVGFWGVGRLFSLRFVYCFFVFVGKWEDLYVSYLFVYNLFDRYLL